MYCLCLLQNQHHTLQINGCIKYYIPIILSNENNDTANNFKMVNPACLELLEYSQE